MANAVTALDTESHCMQTSTESGTTLRMRCSRPLSGLSRIGLAISILALPGAASSQPGELLASLQTYPVLSAFFVLQIALSIALLLEYRKRQRARRETQMQQSELAHAARLALVGEITGSIAHEVSQPLSAILSNADAADLLLAADPPRVTDVREILADIKRDDLRAHEIVRNLRSLLRKREVQIETVDLNQVTRSALGLVQADASRRNIVIRAAFDSALPAVAGDAVHLQQVLLNLIVNAMDAMADIPPHARRLDVRTQRHDARTAEVAVIDSGHGIEPERLPKLFESFFTTKQEGMGLGLSIARLIVQAHGGRIWADNTTAGGAVFRFTVPLQTH